jgi:hypothetical protein
MERETAKGQRVTEGTAGLADTRTTDVADLRLALARAVAGRKISDDAISAVAKKLAASKQKIRGIDNCVYGICIDYFFDSADDWTKLVPELVRSKDARLHGIEVFPWGIPFPDIYRVRVQQDFPELGGQAQRQPG